MVTTPTRVIFLRSTRIKDKNPMGTAWKMLLRYMGMNAPSQSLRVKMYRWAGIKIGDPFVFGSHIFMDVMFPNISIGDDVILAGYDYVLSHSNVLWGYKAGEAHVSVEPDDVFAGCLLHDHLSRDAKAACFLQNSDAAIVDC